MRRLLEPTERFSEILFGLIMVMTFTGTLAVAEAGREDVRGMLVAALGCNLAWGITDAFMYVINSISMRARASRLLRDLKTTSSAEAGRRMVVGVLPEMVAALTTADELETLRCRLVALPDPPAGIRFRFEDLKAAAAVCLLVFLSTFPVAVPFMLIENARLALRISNAVALVMMFTLGHALGTYIGVRPWRLGFGMLFVGAILVAIVIALGG